MKSYLLIFTFLIFMHSIFSQVKIENDIESALVNSKKGVYWALANIPLKKARLDQSIINEDKLLAKVKIEKEINGIRIESTGYNETNEVTVVIYRSKDSLIKDGFIKKNDIESFDNDEWIIVILDT